MREKAPACCAEERQAWREEVHAVDPRKSTRLDLMKCKLRRMFNGMSRSTAAHQPDPTAETRPPTSFLDLPLELREMVYEHYMSEWSKQRLAPLHLSSPSGQPYPPEHFYKPIPPHEPPLTRACRIIRKETRPLFYSTHRFPVIVHADASGKMSPAPISPVPGYKRLKSAQKRQIRHLEVYFCFEMKDCDDGVRSPSATSYDVDFDAQTGRWQVFNIRVDKKPGGDLSDDVSRLRHGLSILNRMEDQYFFLSVMRKAAWAMPKEVRARDLATLFPPYTVRELDALSEYKRQLLGWGREKVFYK